jgi:hypothetical protein
VPEELLDGLIHLLDGRSPEDRDHADKSVGLPEILKEAQ